MKRQVLFLIAALLAAPMLQAKPDKLGCLAGDCQNGIGTLVDKGDDGYFKYQGSFVDGKFNGFGRLENLDKHEVYKGTFLVGMRNGRGSFWDAENNVYIGQWKHDRRFGMGIQAYHVDGWKEDAHTERWLSKHSENYYGQFRNDTFDGQGTYTWPNGVSYTGGWVNNKKNGKGYFLYPTGLRSDRNFSFDKQVYDETPSF